MKRQPNNAPFRKKERVKHEMRISEVGKVGQSRLDDRNEGYNEGLGSASAYDTQQIVIKRKMKIDNYWN